MADDITIKPADGTWVVRAGGAVLGESEKALEVSQGDDVTVYFPKADIATVFLDASDKTESFPLGEATFYSIVTKSTTLQNSAWSFESPIDGGSEITGYLAFETGDLVAVEKL
ncbi:MAG: DUF427 domain-containing protein [Silicimonas sp.]|nr:DUF427 domain-containing protein [Silicimonas sp.]